MILAIDPGNEQSAFALYDGRLHDFGKLPNEELVAYMPHLRIASNALCIEMIASYGMPVGREVFETCTWIGHFERVWLAMGGDCSRMYRKDVKLHLCGQARAKDGNIRQALIDRFGGKDRAVGRKATPGPLYGAKADVWAALAVAVTHADKHALRAA